MNMAIKQVVKRDGIPFEVVNLKPNKDLIEALNEGKQIVKEIKKGNRRGYNNVSDMMDTILNED